MTQSLIGSHAESVPIHRKPISTPQLGHNKRILYVLPTDWRHFEVELPVQKQGAMAI